MTTNNYSNEIVEALVEELEDFAEYDNVTYEVWAIGYDNNDCVTDTDMHLKGFKDPEEAIAYAKSFTLADLVYKAAEEKQADITTTPPIAYISIEVETVVEDEFEGTMNVGTIYKKDVSLSEEDGPAEDNEETNVVLISSEDYTLNEDGSIEVSCELLKNYNKNDHIQVMFVDEDNQPVLTYKIISKTTANKYVCEFIY